MYSVERIHEPIDRQAPPVSPAGELDLEAPEEALHGGVVRRASLLRHRAHDTVALATLYPARPAAVATAIAMADGGFALG